MQQPETDNRTALLVIDMQKGFINENTNHLPEKIEALQRNYKLVIATRFFNPPGSAYRMLLHWNSFERGSDEFQLAFKPVTGAAIMDKGKYNGITAEMLALLNRHKIHTVHLAGVDTNMCIFINAATLFETHKIRPVVLYPYCASHSGADCHEAALRLLELAIGKEQIWRNPRA